MVELILGFLGTIATIVISLASLAYWLGRRFAEIDLRFKQIEGRFKSMEDGLKEEFKHVENRFKDIEGLIAHNMRVLANAMTESQMVVVEFLSLKGVIDRGEAEYPARRVEGLLRLATLNPLTKEEWEFLRNFFSRAARDVDSVTIEEAEKAYELGRKLFVEDFDERGYKIAIAAGYIKGYLISREVRKEKERKQKQQEQQA